MERERPDLPRALALVTAKPFADLQQEDVAPIVRRILERREVVDAVDVARFTSAI